MARLAVRSGHSKDLEIVVLRHQLAVLRRQIRRLGLFHPKHAGRSLEDGVAAMRRVVEEAWPCFAARRSGRIDEARPDPGPDTGGNTGVR